MGRIRGKYLDAYLQNVNDDSEQIKLKIIKDLEFNYALGAITFIILMGLFTLLHNTL